MVALMCDIPLNTLGKKQGCFAGVPAAWRVEIDGDKAYIFGRRESPHTVRLYAKTLFVAEPDRNLVQRIKPTCATSR